MSNPPILPGFMVIHGNQPEILLGLLIEWMKAHPLRPLEDELILVQSNGIAQWLKLALAADPAGNGGGCGIAAALETVLPSRFVWQAYRAVLGADAVPETSPYDKPLLLWRLMRLLPELVRREAFAPLARFLQDDAGLRKRYQLAERLADLFDQYQVYRADWLESWGAGKDILTDGRGGASPLPPDQAWQPALWRALLADTAEVNPTSRAAIHRRFLEAASGTAPASRPPALPRRVIVFGLSSLPRQSLEVLAAISPWCQVLLCVHNPCQHYWAHVVSEQDLVRRSKHRHGPKKDMPAVLDPDTLHLHAQPLLAAWGKQGRDYIALLEEQDDADTYRQRLTDIGRDIDLFLSHGEGSLLNQLQEDIRLLRAPAETREHWPPVDPAKDASLRFHVAHGRQREVEILQDQLLAAFDADPTLRPRDVIVMVPDIDAYAPHVQAVFGRLGKADPRHVPFSMADQGRRHQDPMLNALEFLLGLNESRFAVSDILDFLDVPAVRRRFGIEEADLPLLHRWIHSANIRWGLDGRQRRALGLEHCGDGNTWSFGLKRMLLGYAVGAGQDGESRHWNGIEGFAEVAGLDAMLVGPLVLLMKRLGQLLETLSGPASPATWNERLQSLLSDFFEASGDEETGLLLELQTELHAWTEACGSAALEEPLPLAIVREHWLSRMDQGGLSQRFLGGRLTFATLMPMRAIPFRMVCLLGMNDGDYPRSRRPADFDLMARDYRAGDRSRREDDRYLFLEALLSARDRLHVSWVGRSIHDNTPSPPSVLVGQLRDHIEACWKMAPDTGGRLIDALTIEHRLQPFSPKYFAEAPPDSRFFTYAREWQGEPPPSPPSGNGSGTRLPPMEIGEPVTLERLAGFLKDPVRTFLRDRLKIHYGTSDPGSDDQEPFTIAGLEGWSLQDELIRAGAAALHEGQDEREAVARQWQRIGRRGSLPAGHFATLLEAELVPPLEDMFGRYRAALSAWPVPLEDRVLAEEGPPLAFRGRIDRLHGDGRGGRCRILLESSRLIRNRSYRRERFLAAWVTHLAGHLDGEPLTTLLIGKDADATLLPLDPERARGEFRNLLEAFLEGLCTPIPFAPRSALAWLEARPGKAQEDARNVYEGDVFGARGEVEGNPYLQRIYPDFESLQAGGGFEAWSGRLLQGFLSATGQGVPGSAGDAK